MNLYQSLPKNQTIGALFGVTEILIAPIRSVLFFLLEIDKLDPMYYKYTGGLENETNLTNCHCTTHIDTIYLGITTSM